MQTIVKYHNSLNDLAFRGFSTNDYNFFFAICSKLQGKETEKVVFSYTELRKLAGIDKNYTPKEFDDRLERMYYKLLHLDFVFIDGRRKKYFVFFPTFDQDEENQTVTVSINPDAVFLLNNLTSKFTMIELQQFVQLDSKYAKTLYRLLKQFKSTGELRVPVDNFKRVLDIPDNYTNKKITEKIIKPAVNALKSYFPNLEFETIHALKRGRPVVGYLFRFDKENPIEHQVTIQEELQRQGYEKVPHGDSKKKKPGFNDFEQNDYDFDNIYKALGLS